MQHSVRYSRIGLTVLVLTVFLLPSVCPAADFSAKMITSFGKVKATGKLYVTGSNWRQDTSVEGRQQVIIARGKTAYVLDPKTKQYRLGQLPAKPWSASSQAALISGGAVRKSLGRKTVNGVACEGFVYTRKGASAQGAITQYVAKDLDLPVRTEFKSPQRTMTIEFTSIKKGPCPASLFQIPKGYKKMPVPKRPPQKTPTRK